jgi:hypothetical protein
MRASFDANPSYDPTQRNPGMSSSGMRSHAGRGGGGGMYADELNPEDLFNMFFGGGGRGGQFGGGQFGNANGMPHCHLCCTQILTFSLYIWRRKRFPSYWWRSSSASTSRRSRCQPDRRFTTHHHPIRLCSHLALTFPTIRFDGARSRIYIRANGQVLDG